MRSLMRVRSRKRPALDATTFLNSRGGRLRELRLYSVTWTALLSIYCFPNWSSSPEVFHSHIYQPENVTE